MATVELRKARAVASNTHRELRRRRYKLADVTAPSEVQLCIQQATTLASFPEWRGAQVEVGEDAKGPWARVTHPSGAVARFGATARAAYYVSHPPLKRRGSRK